LVLLDSERQRKARERTRRSKHRRRRRRRILNVLLGIVHVPRFEVVGEGSRSGTRKSSAKRESLLRDEDASLQLVRSLLPPLLLVEVLLRVLDLVLVVAAHIVRRVELPVRPSFVSIRTYSGLRRELLDERDLLPALPLIRVRASWFTFRDETLLRHVLDDRDPGRGALIDLPVSLAPERYALAPGMSRRSPFSSRRS
jgi:hypothetical protein